MKMYIIDEGIVYDRFSKESILAAAIIKKAQSKDPSGHKLAGYVIGVEPPAKGNAALYGAGNAIVLARQLYPSENPAYDRISCIVAGGNTCGGAGSISCMLVQRSSNNAFLDYCVAAATDYLNSNPADTIMFELDPNGSLDELSCAPLYHRAVDQAALALDYIAKSPNWRNVYYREFDPAVLPELMKVFKHSFVADDGHTVINPFGAVTRLDTCLYNRLHIAMSPLIIVA